ncbi:MAG: phosphoribosyl-ATP diphosphatase, partial [Candidatus Bathyarchaeia archaeon]
VKVQQIGPACHTNKDSCFHKLLVQEEQAQPASTILERIYETILERMRTGNERSYVRSLTGKGEEAILAKISEESEEVVQAAKGKPSLIVSEVSDLIFHLMVFLASKGISLGELFREFERRHRKKTGGRG